MMKVRHSTSKNIAEKNTKVKRAMKQPQRLVVLFFAASLGITGCAAQDQSESLKATSNTASSDQGNTESVSEPLDPATCLEGTWLVENEYFLAQFKELGGSENTQVTGEVTQIFDASGQLTTTYDDWRIAMAVDGADTTILRTGTDHGTYTSDGSVVSVQETDAGSTITLTAAGMEQVISADALEYVEAPYTCDATSASINAPDGTANLTRIR